LPLSFGDCLSSQLLRLQALGCIKKVTLREGPLLADSSLSLFPKTRHSSGKS